jgi:hypothetical protein
MRFAIITLCAVAVFAFAGPAPAQETTASSAPAAEQTAPTTEQTAPTAEPTASTAEQAPAATTPEQAAPVETAPRPPLPGGLSAPPEGKGQIVFFRPNRFAGGALTFTVRENEVPLGRLSSGRYFVHPADAGIHEYEVGNNDTMRMEIEPGETYFVVNNIQMGIVAGRAVLAPSTPDEFSAALPRMRLSRPIEE